MKTALLLTLLVLTNIAGIAQPYFPVERGKVTYYVSGGGGYNSQIIDSNMNTYFFNPQFLQTTFDTINYCEGTLLYSFWGKKMTLQGDTIVHFFNQFDEPIELRLNTLLKDKWLAYSNKWADIYYEHSSNDSLKYLPNDIIMVKVFTPSVVMKDSSFIQYQDIAELPTLKLNEKHGLVVSANFFNFPYLSPYSIFYNLSDIYPSDLINSKVFGANYSSYKIDTYNITWDSIFRFEIGDEFHTQTISPNSLDLIEQRVNKIIEAKYYQDSFTYKIARVNYLIHSTESQLNQSFYDTIIVTHKHNPILDLEPYSSINLYKTEIEYNTIQKSSFPFRLYSLNNDSCIKSLNPPPPPVMQYLNHGGGPYYGQLEFGKSHHRLLYIKNQNNTWGEPLSRTVGLKNIETVEYNLYPNPASGIINVTLQKVGAAKFKVYSITGVQVHETELNSFQNNIEIGELKEDIYFYQIEQGAQTAYGKLIKQ